MSESIPTKTQGPEVFNENVPDNVGTVRSDKMRAVDSDNLRGMIESGTISREDMASLRDAMDDEGMVLVNGTRIPFSEAMRIDQERLAFEHSDRVVDNGDETFAADLKKKRDSSGLQQIAEKWAEEDSERKRREKERKESERGDIEHAKEWYGRAQQIAARIIENHELPYRVKVSSVEIRFEDGYVSVGLALRFSHETDNDKSWTMSIDMSDDYLENEFESVILRLVTLKTELQPSRETGGDDSFDNQIFKSLEGKEREKTMEEQELIKHANQLINAMRNDFGLEQQSVPDRAIHIVRKEEWLGSSSAVYAEEIRAIGIKETPANIVFLKKIVHEMLHDNIENNVLPRPLNEALVEHLTMHIMGAAASNPLTTTDRARSVRVREEWAGIRDEKGSELFTEDTYYAFVDDTGRVHSENFTYKRERDVLDLFTDFIVEHDVKQRFANSDEVLQAMTQSLLERNISGLDFIGDIMGKDALARMRDTGIEQIHAYIEELGANTKNR